MMTCRKRSKPVFWTPARCNLLIRMQAEDMPVGQMAAALGVSKSAVHSRLYILFPPDEKPKPVLDGRMKRRLKPRNRNFSLAGRPPRKRYYAMAAE